MTDNTQPEALRLIEQYDYGDPATYGNVWKAAACNELLRQHTRIAELEAVGAGGVQALSAAQTLPESFLRDVVMLCNNQGASPESIESFDREDKWIADLWRTANTMLAASPTPPAEQQAQPGAVGRTGCTAGTDEECTRRGCATTCPALQAAPKAAPSEGGDETDWYHGITEKHFDRAVQKAVQRDRASRAATPKAAPGDQFDSEGFRAWVLRNLPDETIIGSSAWWADHLTTWAQRFVKAAPQQEAQEPTEVPYQKLTNEIDLILSDPDTELSTGAKRALLWMRTWVSVPLYTAPQPAPAPLSDAVVKDAARYRWLRENWFTMTSNYQRCITFKVGEPRWSDITEEELDAAIDAARKQGANHD